MLIENINVPLYMLIENININVFQPPQELYLTCKLCAVLGVFSMCNCHL